MATLRRITVDEKKYLWKFHSAYRRVNGSTRLYQCDNQFTAWLEGVKTSSFQVEFITQEEPIFVGENISLIINLNEPKWAAEIIREAIQEGWTPELAKNPLHIKDGIFILQRLCERKTQH